MVESIYNLGGVSDCAKAVVVHSVDANEGAGQIHRPPAPNRPPVGRKPPAHGPPAHGAASGIPRISAGGARSKLSAAGR